MNVHQQVRGGACDNASCRTAAVKRWVAQRHAAQEAAQKAAVSAHLPAMLANRQQREADVVVVAVSTSLTALESVSTARREALCESVAKAVAASAEAEPDVAPTERPPPEGAPPSAAIAAACATCRGYCCRRGGDSAYIDAGTVRRVRSQRPDLSPGEVVALYAEAVPQRSTERSCIFHGEHGCALARELRSDTCNDYFCQPMREWIATPAATAAPLTAVIIVHEDRVIRSTLIDRQDG
jgi:hypothetical protein